MLRFERIPSSRSIGLSLRKKSPFLTREIFLSLMAVILAHILFFFLFSIKTITPEQSVNFSTMEIAWIPHPGSTLLLKEPLAETPLLNPPTLPLPSLHETYPPLKEEINLNPAKCQKGSFAWVCGDYPRELVAPCLLCLDNEESALLTFRSDSAGDIFWYDWIKKTSKIDLDKEIEKWIKTVKLNPQAAFYPQQLDLRLVP